MSRIEKLLELLQSSPGDSFLQHALALEYIKIENDTAAQQMFEAILLREPGYVGSYYHLAKLFERSGDFPKATEVYEAGMRQARIAGDNHSYNELQAALEDIDQ